MKRLLCLVLCGLLPWLSAVGNGVQRVDSLAESRNEGYVREYRSADDDDFSIGIGSYKFRFSDNSRIRKERSLTLTVGPEFGFNGFTKPDYGFYDPDEGDFLDLNTARSLQVKLYLSFDMPLNRARTLVLSTGLGIVWNDYVLSGDVTLAKEGGAVVPRPIDASYKKSKINTFSLRVPFVVDYNLPKGFFVGAGVYGEVLVGSHTKIKFPKQKMRNPYTSPWQAGVVGRIGFRGIYIYGEYAFVPFFKSGKGPRTHTYTFGIGWGF